ncbi:hypothetical protein DCO58_05690 [Helicobacter saguini]|uniref:hypothetical protein n=1 Tax=Helicobacter saguini TaxID=1548018 RepID=UPI000E58DBA0|nr:hypothetical protein [Helicobacter saguini]MWV62160.1 hypothetical protein [Helicobacter saguini]MWV67167.1 hypothetical protein [Helicobacter saguini]MWV70930.1 hypothetical protein [Helicobacter saguini]
MKSQDSIESNPTKGWWAGDRKLDSIESNKDVESNKDIILSEAKNLTFSNKDSKNIDISLPLNMTNKIDSIESNKDVILSEAKNLTFSNKDSKNIDISLPLNMTNKIDSIESNKDVILSEAKNLTKNKLDSIDSKNTNIDISPSLNMTDKTDSIESKIHTQNTNKWVNLSLLGGSFKTRAVILEYLFNHKKIDNIIYSIDGFNVADDTKDFDFLYKNPTLKNLKIYMNPKNIFCAIIWSKSPKCVGEVINIYETPQMKWSEGNEYFGGLNNFLQKKANIAELKQIKTKIHSEMSMESFKKISQDSINNYLFSFIKSHKDTNFYLVIPAFHRTNYLVRGREYFSMWAAVIREFVLECEKFSNVRIYGFDLLSFADNIANYKDVVHHNSQMNSIYIESIAKGEHILNAANIDTYLAKMQEKIQNYDTTEIFNIIESRF